MSISSYIKLETVASKMYKPCDPSSLAVIRILFGFLMLVDIVEERGGGDVDIIWGEPKNCHFPLFPFLRPMALNNMSLLFGLMWLGALGIMLGFKYRCSCMMFIVSYWYVFLLDKSYWNNHSYLYGLIGILLTGTSASNVWSLDAFFGAKNNKPVPYWNYFVLKFQIFILYFYAGLKKTDMEWLDGYSMANLGLHWVFDPLKFILSLRQVDYIVIHCFGFLLDLTVGFLLIYSKTRPMGICMCAAFHCINSRMFSIGVFPYVCMATLPIFCDFDWPKKRLQQLQMFWKNIKKDDIAVLDKREENVTISFKQKLVTLLVLTHCGLQGFLPYSHFITKGFNNWTNGLYGYSWDMMIHSWDTVLVVVKVVDNHSGKEHFLDPSAWTTNGRWTKHADMVVQYAQCLQTNLLSELHGHTGQPSSSISEFITSDNISIYLDVWCSMNGRFQQRMYDPNYDLLKAKWSVFASAKWLMPLLTEYSNYRTSMDQIQQHVHSWSNYSDVLFIADFPDLSLDNYISDDLTNVSLTILTGDVEYTDELSDAVFELTRGERISVPSGIFHKVTTVGKKPSSYMYTYTNKTQESSKEVARATGNSRRSRSPLPLIEDGNVFFESLFRMFNIIGNSVLNIFLGVPMTRRTRIR